MIQSRKELGDLPKTVHGGQAWKQGKVEDYSHNLNPFGPPEDLSEIMQKAVSDIGHYPDDYCTELKNTISQVFGIPEKCITIGAGSSDIIRNFPNTFFSPGDRVVMHRPSFAEYTQQCKIVGANVVFNNLTEENDFRIDRNAITEQIKLGAKAVYICNPNNPTGRVEPRDKILEIVEECEKSDVLVFLDETLLELVENYSEVSCARYVTKFSNLVVAGSLTKSFAIPGIRIGFGFSNPSIISEMEKVRMTWNVGQVEQTVANELIATRMHYVDEAARIMAEESKNMNEQLKDLGFPVGDVSDSFFYFCSLKSLGIKCSEFQEKMLKHGIMVRDCASFGEPFEWFVRFSVKDKARNDLFVSAVSKVMSEMGL